MEQIETIVVGGGQAGLTTSYCLSKSGREHIVLERGSKPANSWGNRCWDSFTLVTPNRAFKYRVLISTMPVAMGSCHTKKESTKLKGCRSNNITAFNAY